MGKLKIRRMVKADVAEIAELSRELGYALPPQDLAGRFAKSAAVEGGVVFVAEEPKGSIAGWLHAAPRHVVDLPPHLEIAGLVVGATFRRQGIGRDLMLHLERWGRKQGFRHLLVRSNVRRVEAHEFYPGVGFTLLKTQHVYERRLP